MDTFRHKWTAQSDLAVALPLGVERLTTVDDNHQEVIIDLANKTSPMFVSVRVRIDTEVPPGLYDDFLVTRLLNKSQNFTFVASLGFSA